MPDISPANTPSNVITWDSVTDVFPMTNAHTQIPSESQVYLGDLAVYDATRNKAYIGGSMVYDAVPWLNTANTNASGVATFYPTDTGLAGGNALFSSIDTKTVIAMPTGGTNNYQVTSFTIASDKKSITVSVNQMAGAVLGLVNVTTAAAGIPVTLSFLGK